MQSSNIIFQNPLGLLMLVLLPVALALIFYFRDKQKLKNFVPFSSLILVESLKQKINQLPLIIILTVFVLTYIFQVFVVSEIKLVRNVTSESQNIVLLLDVSNSMIAQDLEPNRFEVEKDFATNFLGSLSKDSNVSLIAFSGSVEILSRDDSPENIENIIQNLNISDLSPRTALGDAVSNAYRIISQSGNENSGNIILITDGESNSGVDPINVVENLGNENIKIFTVGIGGYDEINIDIRLDDESIVNSNIPPLNTEELESIADLSGGEFYRAGDEIEIEEIVEQISQNESFINSEEIINIDRLFKWLSICGFIFVGSFGIIRFR